MLNRSILGSWLVITIGIVLAVAVFVLLITGVFTLMNIVSFNIGIFTLALLNLLVLELGFLLSRQRMEVRWGIRVYLRLALTGTVGILVTLLLEVLLSTAFPVALMVFIAVDFFFLALLLGGAALLIIEFARWRIAL